MLLKLCKLIFIDLYILYIYLWYRMFNFTTANSQLLYMHMVRDLHDKYIS